MFTSLNTKTGKTYNALNLAMSLAIAGKKVALVDMDLRKATLSRMISLPEIGINNFLNGNISDVRQIIQRDYLYLGFDLIPVGEIPQNPTELLISDQLPLFLEKLKSTYDYIFLDCTTLDITADATIISKHADLAVLVVRERHSSRRIIPELEKLFTKGQFKNMAIILNDSKQEIFVNDNKKEQEKNIIDNVIKLPRTKLLQDKKKYLTKGTKSS